MSSKLKVRMYEPGDEKGIIYLLKYVFEEWPHFDLTCSSEEHWKWKYLKKEYFPKIAIAEYNGEIVAVNSGVPVKIKIGNKILLCNQSTDLVIHPDYRKMKLYEYMSKERVKHHMETGDNLNYAVSGVPRVIEISKKLGRPTFPKQIKLLAKINDINLHTDMKKTQNPLFVKIGFKLLETTHKIMQFRKKGGLNLDLKSKDITQFDDKYAIFWDKIKDKYDFILEKTPEHLNWRYLDPRGGNYIIKHVEDESGILGYIVLRVNKFNPVYSEGYIVDLVCLPGRLDVVSLLISDSIEYFDKLGLNAVFIWCLEDHPYLESIKSYGFLDSMNNPFVQFNTYNIGPEWESFVNAPSSRLSFQLGDTDWI